VRRLLPVAVAVVLAVAFLLAPVMGTDLSAQVARADFFAAYGWAPLDFGWYAGVSPHGYSLTTPPLMTGLGGGLTGPRVLGALAAVASTAVFYLLLTRTGAARPVLGGALAAFCFVGNLVSGRITYAVGVTVGLAALLAVTASRPAVRLGGALAGAALAAATSPVAGLFVALAGVAWAATGLARGSERPDGARLAAGTALVVGAAVPMVAMAVLFGAGGWMNISRWDTTRATVTGLVVAVLVPRPAVRIGALLSSAGVLLSFAVHTPVGLNATRLAAMFALPVLAAYARIPRLRTTRPQVSRMALAAVLAAVAVWQPPVMTADLRAAGDSTAQRAYFAPLLAELARRAPVGRVEVVPLANYWESAYVPPTAPLARGWLRQADLAHNADLFFDGRLNGAEYERWLRDNGVSYVAVADAPPSWVGRAEAALIRGGLPYLTTAWRGDEWTLYEVVDAPSIVVGARLVASTPDGVTLAAGPGQVLLRVRWSRWLSVRGAGACLAPHGKWTELRVDRAGRYVVTGGLANRGPFCPERATAVGHR
jgi:hypothetical protein